MPPHQNEGGKKIARFISRASLKRHAENVSPEHTPSWVCPAPVKDPPKDRVLVMCSHTSCGALFLHFQTMPPPVGPGSGCGAFRGELERRMTVLRVLLGIDSSAHSR